ncbi:Glycosyltransferase, group 2 family protein [[Clostridium] ultunense Esp]|uniref:glycosyltransferase family 2 protein n=1 Tax=Thermicanus aegyptius TaxID=94009 RepID=UPI0002B6F9AA|nr:glycosyltransferase family A protein [Thermicanus aegyptius]CCQ96870.1 Glycosyltransferase, group 2 family protein [[Clostridium] ultunense Esp]
MLKRRKRAQKKRYGGKMLSFKNNGITKEKRDWQKESYRAGEEYSLIYGEELKRMLEEDERKAAEKRVNQLWLEWYQEKTHLISLKEYAASAGSFIQAFLDRHIPLPGHFLPLPTHSSVAAVLSVRNEERTLPHLLRRLEKLPLEEVILVVNGSTDRSLTIAEDTPFVHLVRYDEPLGHDVGRAVGAAATAADILLFLDADMVIAEEHLLPFIAAVEKGADVALNDLTPYLPTFPHWDRVTILKEFLNRVLGRFDLHANSLTAVPHALSRQAVNEIGSATLMVPPRAHALALLKGLKVVAPYSVDVISRNRLRKENMGACNPVEELIIGDYLEAIAAAMQWKGERLGYEDLFRKRHVLHHS